MTFDEARQVFLSRGYVEVEGGTIYDADKWRESCRVISEWLEQEPKMLSEIEHLHKYISKLETQIVEQESIDKSAMMYDIYMEGVNMSGEYQGCWVRLRTLRK